MDELAKLLGLGPPVVAAGAIYWLFSFLDRKASDEANQAVASWMKGERYNQIDLGKAVISAFDHIYGTPLFRWKALYRSAILSSFAILIYWFWSHWLQVDRIPVLSSDLLQLLPIIVGDYLSLYVVRASLKRATGNVLLSIILSVSFGYLVIVVVGELYLLIMILRSMSVEYARYFVLLLINQNMEFEMLLDPNLYIAVAPAFLVHLWLPLLVIGALLNRGLGAFFRAVGVAQRFIKHGNEHPFDAIGIIAATVVFVVTAVWTIASHFI
jgi:hypothetical protein